MHIDYYYTPVSPYSYLGAHRLRELAHRHNATIVHKPVDFGRIFAATGGVPVAQRPPARQAYRLIELKRWAAQLDLPLNLHPKHFPVPAELASRTIIAALGAGCDPTPFAEALMTAVWAEDRDISDPDTVAAIADATGLPGSTLVSAGRQAITAAAYTALTEEAIGRGVFGAPTYVFRDELFWGQDRLDFLERALARAAA